MASRLTGTARQRAVNFIRTHGTELTGALYDFHFSNSGPDPVLAALASYQNGDGGFGHGLESDLCTPNSSVLATSVALQMIVEVGAHATPMVERALGYLGSQYRRGNWPLIHPDCNDAPHAPWWTWDDATYGGSGFRANPGAEILSYLIRWSGYHQCHLDQALREATQHLSNSPLEMHELKCYLRLYDTPELDAAIKDQMLPLLLCQAYQLVKVTPTDWEEYGLTPIDVVPNPDSPFAEFFGESLDRNLDYQIARQQDDGGWPPAWSWGNAFPDAWREAEREIKALLTLRFLVQLREFARLD